MVKLPGVKTATVKVKEGDVRVLTSDKRTGAPHIAKAIGQAKFELVSIEGPLPIEQ